jgi:hypothetical protein
MAEKKATRIDSDVLSRLASGQNQVASFYLPPPAHDAEAPNSTLSWWARRPSRARP